MKRNHVLQCYKTARPTYHKFLRADPVVLRELDIELDVKISLVEGVSVLWHSLSSHHPDRAWGQENTLSGLRLSPAWILFMGQNLITSLDLRDQKINALQNSPF